ncbi:hypothetical protein AB0P36_32675 [Streptomyces flavidovirens]|uniref:hypothetical protein n=1 Tax=Streptomyces flavidovirens TaxID=67298 RepID=UPI003435892F
MVLPLWLVAVAIPEFVLTCILLRWLPDRRERWIPVIPLPAVIMVALIMRYGAQVSWPGTFAACSGFLWGVTMALLPFRRWVSSWTLPIHGEARLRWHEIVLVTLNVTTPLSTKRTKAATEKAFATRQVVHARGRFPLTMGVALLVIPVVCAVAAGLAADALGVGLAVVHH